MKFKYTKEGCEAAKIYLKNISKYGTVSRSDGWTIISYANTLYKKRKNGAKANAAVC